MFWVKSMIGNDAPESAGTWHGWEASSVFLCGLDSDSRLICGSAAERIFSFCIAISQILDVYTVMPENA